MEKNLASRFAVQYTARRASKTLPFCAVQKRYQNAFKSWVAMS